jgi:ABC-type dipeptide/oligopeptide/nickel transport system ATPase component
MRQRVMIAMAIAARQKLLIADEPTTALDLTVQANILELLQRLRSELQMAILLITHDFGVVAEIADRVTVMYAGQVVENAPASIMFDTPKHLYTEAACHLHDHGLRLDGRSVLPRRKAARAHSFWKKTIFWAACFQRE